MPDRHDLGGLSGLEPGTSYQGKDTPSSEAPTSPRLVVAVSLRDWLRDVDAVTSAVMRPSAP
jgi:hypothetical protein